MKKICLFAASAALFLSAGFAGDVSVGDQTMTTEEVVKAATDILEAIGAEKVAVHEPCPEADDEEIVRTTVEIDAAEGSFLRGFCDFKPDPEAFVWNADCFPYDAYLMVAVNSDLLWTENTANRLREHLPDFANMLDVLRAAADDVCGGMYVSVVPDVDGEGLDRLGMTFGVGVKGVEMWNCLSNILSKTGEIVEGRQLADGERSIFLKPDGMIGRFLGGREPQLVLVPAGNLYRICGYSSETVRTRCCEDREVGRTLLTNPVFQKKAAPLVNDRDQNRAWRGFAYASPDFLDRFMEATHGLFNLPLGLLGFYDFWGFSMIETTADRIFVTSRQARSTWEGFEILGRFGVNLVGNAFPGIWDVVKFDKEYVPSEEMRMNLDAALTLLRLARSSFGVKGLDYRYRPETAEARAKAGIPEPGEDYVATILSVKMMSEESLLLNLFTAGTAADQAIRPGADDANAAERYLPDNAVAAFAFQPDTKAWLDLLSLGLETLGHADISEFLYQALPCESDRHSCAVALSRDECDDGKTEDGETADPAYGLLIVSRIGIEQSFRELGGKLGDIWELEDEGDLLLYRRTEGPEIVQDVRIAFHRKEGMTFFATSRKVLDQAVAAGVGGQGRLYDSEAFRRTMGTCRPHNTLRYRAEGVGNGSSGKLANMLAGILPGGFLSRVLSLNLFNVAECGFGVKSGDTYLRFGREPKRQHIKIKPMVESAFKTVGEALQRVSPYDVKGVHAFSAVFARHVVDVSEEEGRLVDREQGLSVAGWTFAAAPATFDRTRIVEMRNPGTFEDGTRLAFCNGAVFALRLDDVSGEMMVGFEDLSSDPTCTGGTIAGEGDGAWSVSPTDGAAAVIVAGLPESAKVAVPPSVGRVCGVEDGQIEVHARGVDGGGAAVTYDITGAFTVEDGAILLNPVGSVFVGAERISTTPEIGDQGLETGADGVGITAKAIPGLRYALKRAEALQPVGDGGSDPGWTTVDGPATATGPRMTLTDAEPPAERAFYVIEASKP